MSAAGRMRKYRARKALREALDRAARNGVDVGAVIGEWELQRLLNDPEAKPVTPIDVTPSEATSCEEKRAEIERHNQESLDALATFQAALHRARGASER